MAMAKALCGDLYIQAVKAQIRITSRSELWTMPPIPWRSTVLQHSGSSWDDFLHEREWGAGHQHQIGYKNIQDRVAGITHAQDELSKEDEEAYNEYQELKGDAETATFSIFQKHEWKKQEKEDRKHHDTYSKDGHQIGTNEEKTAYQ
ncbi:hypothetical protein FKW77_006628 [Venturia effusa]|uniref:Uncharacterized protein n=1 Tax=Venturia effusa TaxID=50376 RepID=A0A517LFP8_9PEZI|nr:hypothetical protein FKW77_006628 [Venturia effusa]